MNVMTQNVEMPPYLLQLAVELAAAAPVVLHPEEMEGYEDQAWMDGLHSQLASQERWRWDEQFAQAYVEEMELV